MAGHAREVAVDGSRVDIQVPGDLAIGHAADGLHHNGGVQVRAFLPVVWGKGLGTEAAFAGFACKPLDTVWGLESPVVANLLEDLLFFTDNRNQPRKVNINYQTGYYTIEDQISVAKYYPYQTIELYQGSQVTGAQLPPTTATAASTN